MPTSKVDVSYFRNLIRTETDRLTVLCAVWRSTMEDTSDLSDEGSMSLVAYFNFVDVRPTLLSGVFSIFPLSS